MRYYRNPDDDSPGNFRQPTIEKCQEHIKFWEDQGVTKLSDFNSFDLTKEERDLEKIRWSEAKYYLDRYQKQIGLHSEDSHSYRKPIFSEPAPDSEDYGDFHPVSKAASRQYLYNFFKRQGDRVHAGEEMQEVDTYPFKPRYDESVSLLGQEEADALEDAVFTRADIDLERRRNPLRRSRRNPELSEENINLRRLIDQLGGDPVFRAEQGRYDLHRTLKYKGYLYQIINSRGRGGYDVEVFLPLRGDYKFIDEAHTETKREAHQTAKGIINDAREGGGEHSPSFYGLFHPSYHRRNPVPPNYSFNVDFTTDPYFPPDLLHDAALTFGRAVRVQKSKRGAPPARAYTIGIKFLEAANYVNAYLDSLYNLNEQKEEWLSEEHELDRGLSRASGGDPWPLSSRDERYMQSRRTTHS